MSKFTPGPWAAFHDHPNPETAKSIAYIRAADGSTLYEWGFSEIACCFGCKTPEQAANARLIAAAPDLLEACQTFAEWLRRESAGSTNEPWAGKRDTPEGEAAWREWYDENLRICDLAQEQVRAAIAKATGETP